MSLSFIIYIFLFIKIQFRFNNNSFIINIFCIINNNISIDFILFTSYDIIQIN